MVFSFSGFELDANLYELRKDGAIVHVEPKVFGLIAHFVQHPDRVFSNDELVDAVWDGRVVSDATISSCVKNARKALGDTGSSQRFVKTVRGRGFRFISPVEQSAAPVAPEASPAVQSRAPARHVDPALLVLPFRSLSDSAQITTLSADLATNIGTVLSRIPLLKLSAQTFRYARQPVYPSVRELHEELGVDYVIEGSVQTANDQITIHVQLSDAITGFSLWADKFVFPADQPDTLDNTVVAIVSKTEPQLVRAIYNGVCSQDGTPTARGLYLEASGILALKGWHYKSFPTARDLLRKSRQLAPEFAHASGYLSFVLGLGHRLGILEQRDQVYDEAIEAAENALQLDSMDSTVLGLTGCALSDLGFSPRALPILQNAVDLNRSNAQAWTALGSVCLSQRKLDTAIAHLRHGMLISPLDSRLSVWGSVLSTALRLRGQLEEARIEAELACQREHNAYWPRVALAAALSRQNNSNGALQAMNDAYRAKPDLTPEQIRYLVGQRTARELLALK